MRASLSKESESGKHVAASKVLRPSVDVTPFWSYIHILRKAIPHCQNTTPTRYSYQSLAIRSVATLHIEKYNEFVLLSMSTEKHYFKRQIISDAKKQSCREVKDSIFVCVLVGVTTAISDTWNKPQLHFIGSLRISTLPFSNHLFIWCISLLISALFFCCFLVLTAPQLAIETLHKTVSMFSLVIFLILNSNKNYNDVNTPTTITITTNNYYNQYYYYCNRRHPRRTMPN